MKIKHTPNLLGAKRILAGAALAGVLASALALAPNASVEAKPSKSQASKIAWKTNFESALATAKKSGKPVFVDFYATWCGPCKALDATTFVDSRFVQASRNYVMIKIDGEKRPDLMEKYGLNAYPTLAFFAPNGKLRKVQVGAPATPDLVKMMATYRKA